MRSRSKEYGKLYMRRWRLAHPEYKERAQQRHLAQRRMVLEHYGNACACCGETAFEFLAVDHIAGGGNKHQQQRKANKEDVDMTRWLIRNNFPQGFRVLCHNCNLARGFYGYCPHERVHAQMAA